MKRRMLSLLLVIALAVGMLPVFAAAETTAPTQDDNGVYEISTPEQLLWFAQQVNSGNNNAIKGKLTADIDMSGVSNWPGIGLEPTYDWRGWMSDSSKSFAGSFNGQGYTVTFQDSDWGLFGYIVGTDKAVATVENVKISGTVKHSAVAHEAGYAYFTGCINHATITCYSGYVAGIVGKVIGRTDAGTLKSDVLIKNCGNEASVSAGGGNAGGILGYADTNTRVDGCYNKGNIYANHHVGGIVGYLKQADGTCSVSNSYNTGTVTGTSEVGGILGYMMNGVSVTNCYNAGAAAYAISGKRYDQTAKINNSYYLGTASAKCSPDYNQTTRHDETTNEIQTRAVAKSAGYMASAEFASLLGGSFRQSCPTPVLSWETVVEHTGAVCENCDLGTTEKEVYDVSFQSHNGYTLSGAGRVTEGTSYTLTIAISEGYEKAKNFTVKANGEELKAASDGSYTVHNVSGPLSITVVGVQVRDDSYEIRLPVDGYGYRAAGSKTVQRENDYTFTLSFVDGFSKTDDTKVIAQEILSQELIDKGYTPDEIVLSTQDNQAPYTYTITNVTKNYRILVSGVKVTPTVAPVTVNLTISEGYTKFHTAPGSNKVIMEEKLTVPYFDLSLYGLERYYYNPYCYLDANGNPQSQQKAGTPEIAYNKITLMHAYIVATEIYRLGYGAEKVGTGESYRADPTRFSSANPDAAVSWTQGPGSSFMDFWEHGTNMNYYQNYVYPLGAPGWGSTSDQILIEDGDDITLHLITGQGSGSRFGVFTVNDADGKFQQTDIRDEITVDQGQKVKLTLYWTNTTGNYQTRYEKMANKKLVWAPYGLQVSDVSQWLRTPFGDLSDLSLNDPVSKESELGETAMVTDDNGCITINTAGIQPGIYYIGALGGFTEGGGADQSGFVSTGAEAGVSFFKLEIKPYDGKLGDVDGDSYITGNDALQVLRCVAGQSVNINEAFTDVDKDGFITGNDALQILRYVAGGITSFDNTNS